MLEEIKLRMEEVTLTAPSYEELTAIIMCRKLYTPVGYEESIPHEKLNQLQKHFSKGYEFIKDKSEAKDLLFEISEYQTQLKELGIRDSQAGKFKMNPIQLLK